MREKVFPAFLLFFAILLIFAWIFQLGKAEPIYQFLKTQKVRSALEQICQNIDEKNIEERIAEVQSGGIEVRIVDGQGNDLLTTKTIEQNSLTEYTQQDLISLYRNEDFAAAGWEQVTRFNIRQMSGSGEELSHPGKMKYQIITCASLAVQEDGQKFLVLVRSMLIPPKTTMDVMRMQMVFLLLTTLLLMLLLSAYFRQRRLHAINELNQQAMQVAGGKLDVVFHTKNHSELEPLSVSLNNVLQKFSQTEQLRQELVTNISHDLRTPLTMIIGYAEVMRDIEGEGTPENIQVIVDEANRLSLLVNDILELSKLNSEASGLHLKPFCLTDLLVETVERDQKLTAHQGCSIRFEGDCRVWVRADELEISRVVYNFINNAINHTGKEKHIVVMQEIQERKVCIRVKDNGTGIKEEKLSRIWDRYYRVERSKKCTAMAGSGLGLCIVKQVLQQHGAQYGVESKWGEGSTFWFALDILDTESSD